MKSPFKFLDPYTLKDRDVFFGRDQEIEALFEMVSLNRLVLVYGKSGTGKTSLVQCGLADKFELTDWYPIFIHRGEDIRQALDEALRQAMEGEMLETYHDTLEEIYAIHLRPVYLIFDQMEELFISGGYEEQQQFVHIIKGIQEAYLPCRVVFILREEYLAQLYTFEKVIPTVFDRRIRVEPMSQANVREVIISSCNKFNVSLPNPDQDAQTIIDNLSAGKSGIYLPYLQVYLDMLYREDYWDTYPEGTEEELPPLEFTTQEIERFGVIEDVLLRFLHEQEEIIEAALKKEFNTLPENAVVRVLDCFVTEEGTKRPIRYTSENNDIIVDPFFINQSGLEQKTFGVCLKYLEASRLLHSGKDAYELPHDSLAALINSERTEEQRKINEIKRRIKNSYHEYEKTRDFLSRKQLDSFEEYLDQLQLTPPVREFILNSQAFVKKQERTKRRRRKIFIAAVMLFAAVMAVAAIISNNYRVTAEIALADVKLARENEKQAREDQIRLKSESVVEKGRSLMNMGNFSEAIIQFEFALVIDSTNFQSDSLREVCIQKAGLKKQFDEYYLAGDAALNRGDLILAMNNFQSAYKLEIGETQKQQADIKITEVKLKMLPLMKKYMEYATAFKEAEHCQSALEQVKRAKELLLYLNKSEIRQELEQIREIEQSCDLE